MFNLRGLSYCKLTVLVWKEMGIFFFWKCTRNSYFLNVAKCDLINPKVYHKMQKYPSDLTRERLAAEILFL